MYTIDTIDGPIPQLALADPASDSRALLAPTRGGMITQLRLGGHALLYLDEESFQDTGRNVRGGIPVLFPTPGKLADDRWRRGEASGVLRQHGFGRTSAWEIGEHSTDGAASQTIHLRATAATRAQYPWAFDCRYTYRLAGECLRIEQVIHNPGDVPLPFGAGFHPYFLVPQAEKADVRIETAATRAFDNVAKKEGPFTGFDLTQPEVDQFLLDHGSTRSSLTRPGLPGRIVVDADHHFTHWVVWTLQGRDFVCLEPWTCPGDALNTGERLIELPPGETESLWTEIRLD